MEHGWFGMGNKLFAIPWSALTMQLYDNNLRIILNVDKEVLQKAQGFDKSQLPLSYEELASVYTYYGINPTGKRVIKYKLRPDEIILGSTILRIR